MDQTRIGPAETEIVLRSEFCDLRLTIDSGSGAPVRLSPGEPGTGIDLAADVRITCGGSEHRSATGGLEYRDTADVGLIGKSAGGITERATASARTFTVPVALSSEEWRLTWRYEFRADSPRLAVALEIQALTDTVIARDVQVELMMALPEKHRWRLHAPGNHLRPSLPLECLVHPTGVSPAGGLRGSSGVVIAEDPDHARCLVAWPFSDTEIGTIELAPSDAGIGLHWQTDVAGQPGNGGTLSVATLYLDLLQNTTYADVLPQVPSWLADLGVAAPHDCPAWVAHATLYEVQIGFAVFADGWTYAPYPQAADLLADLDRIAALGYNTLQIMPRQPYPSYNVHDYADITTSYGDEAVLEQVVHQAHQLGMRVILDVLLHGVIDKQAVREAVHGVRTGPYAERLADATADSFSLDIAAEADYLIAWSRHILDFEPFWLAGSPERHRLLDEHPEWFCRDSAGHVTGVYTKAFDNAHPGWQRYFIDACLNLVRRLDVDGFRFDAPTYNYFHNWSARTRSNASVSMLGCLPLFSRLRRELRQLKADIMMYTEPSGVLLRQSMDVNYNYDEQWLIPAVMSAGDPGSHSVRDVADVRQWLLERDASLPHRALTAHHIDSHDTFWWPLPGHKWRRDRYGVSATAAWMALFALSGGPYMTFVGGEEGIEEMVRAVHRVRRERPEFVTGTSNAASVAVSERAVYAALRREKGRAGLAVINLSSADCLTEIVLGGLGRHPRPGETFTAEDALQGRHVEFAEAGDGWLATVAMRPFEARALVLDEAVDDRVEPAGTRDRLGPAD